MFRWFALAILLGPRPERQATNVGERRPGSVDNCSKPRKRLLHGDSRPCCASAVPSCDRICDDPAVDDLAPFALPAWIRWIGVIAGLLTIPAVPWVLGSLGHNVSETVLTKRDHQLVTAVLIGGLASGLHKGITCLLRLA